jgi:PTS system fructose-specific IIC component
MKIVGITACPAGIAHTYMAAEKLQKTAEAKGYQAKFETQGAKTDNILTSQEIRDADVVIVAADKAVSLSRFGGKQIKKVSTGRAITDAEGVIDEAIKGVGTFIGEPGDASTLLGLGNGGEKKNLYTHFMNGVNYMLPFVIAGGILIAISFIFGIDSSNPKSDSYNVIAAALMKIGHDNTFAFMVPALAAGISASIAGRIGFTPGFVSGALAMSGGSGFLGGMLGGLLAGYITNIFANKIKIKKTIAPVYHLLAVPLVSIAIIGFIMVFLVNTPVKALLTLLTHYLNGLGTTSGLFFGVLIGIMMASDMGGPINKAISLFSIGLISSGVYTPIAACMAAGMTPPLGLALATILFKQKFTKEERTAGQSCWFLGASYITEGAIPFAVADPLRVIPSLMVGSAVASAISMEVGIKSMAPSGGFWVIFIPHVVSNIPVYLLAIAAGTVVTAIMVGLLKKDKTRAVMEK